MTHFGIREQRVKAFKEASTEGRRKIANENSGIIVSDEAKELTRNLTKLEQLQTSADMLLMYNTQDKISRPDARVRHEVSAFCVGYRTHSNLFKALLATDMSEGNIKKIDDLMRNIEGKVGNGYVMVSDSEVKLLMATANVAIGIAGLAKDMKGLFANEVLKDIEELRDVNVRVNLLEKNLL